MGPVGQLKTPHSVLHRTGKRAFDMPEELALEQFSRYRRAIHLHHRTSSAPAPFVNGSSDQLFSRSGFPENQDRALRGRDQLDLLQHPSKGRALPDDAAKGVSGLDLLLQVFVLELQLLLQPLDFFERARVGDRCGGVIGKGAQPEELLLVDEGAAENSQNTNGLVPENQWVPREALDAFLPQPVAASEPFTIVSGVMKQLGFPCRADLADVSNSQWEPAVRAIHAEPVGAAVLLDGAGGACNQMKASCLVRGNPPARGNRHRYRLAGSTRCERGPPREVPATARRGGSKEQAMPAREPCPGRFA